MREANRNFTSRSLFGRIYNLSEKTTKFLLSLPTPGSTSVADALDNPTGQVRLKAGYEGNFGVIFQGSIAQVISGKENPVDTYVDIFAVDSDFAQNWGVINTTMAAGYAPADVAKEIVKSLAPYGVTAGEFKLPDGAQKLTSPPFDKMPRGRSLFGMARDAARDLADSCSMDWWIKDNKIQFLAQSAYLPGDAILLSAATGLIGLPQQTFQGLQVKCLLNPSIGLGTRVKIDNKSIQMAQLNLAYTAVNVIPPTDADGLYKVWYMDHTGDNRGPAWYTDFTCLSIDPSAAVPLSLSVPTEIPP